MLHPLKANEEGVGTVVLVRKNVSNLLTKSSTTFNFYMFFFKSSLFSEFLGLGNMAHAMRVIYIFWFGQYGPL